jgi:hypothetical protein
MKRYLTFLFTLIILLTSCGNGNAQEWTDGLPVMRDTISFSTLGQPKRGKLVIKDTIDLKNRVCRIPEGVTLKFNCGYIKNGTLVGNMTELKSCKPCFDRVRIQGSWNVPIIKSSWFADLTYDNALQDVIALSNPSIKNKIIIKPGEYQVSTYVNSGVCLAINSNTDLVLDGIVRLVPNNLRVYKIVQIEGENIRLMGKGSIVGDKYIHTGTDGEWGMGIYVSNGHNVEVKGLTVRNCWGDCIYIGNHSTNVNIVNCKLDHGRRQGISITSANGVCIKKCEITNVSGTLPEFAIDMEPNKDERVDNVVIDRVVVTNCIGGIIAVSIAENSSVGSVIVRNCNISSGAQNALVFKHCESAIADRNILSSDKKRQVLLCVNVDTLVLRRNTLSYEYSLLDDAKAVVKKIVRGEESSFIRMIDCNNYTIRDNAEYK